MTPILLSIAYIVLYVITNSFNLEYKDLDNRFIGKPVSHIETFLNQKYTFDFTMKGFVGFPYKTYKTGCGKGYALTVYLNRDETVHSIKNEVSYVCNDRVLLRKRIYTSDKEHDTEISIWPFI